MREPSPAQWLGGGQRLPEGISNHIATEITRAEGATSGEGLGKQAEGQWQRGNG